MELLQQIQMQPVLAGRRFRRSNPGIKLPDAIIAATAPALNGKLHPEFLCAIQALP
jgi:hypothetical protein